MFIPYERIVKCVGDERIFVKCKARIFYYTMTIPPIGTVFEQNGVKYATSADRPIILTDMHNNVQNITYAELCTTYLLFGSAINVYTLVHYCTWNDVSGYLNSDVLWGTVYTCDDIQVHTRTQDYLIMRLPESCETRYIPTNTDGRVDIAVQSFTDNYVYFLCPVCNNVPQVEHMKHIDTVYMYNNLMGCTFDADTEYTRRVLTKI